MSASGAPPVPGLLFWRAAGVAGLATGLAACGPPAAQPEHWSLSAEARQGRELLAQFQCGSCHRIPAVPAAQGVSGPPLHGYGGRSYIAGHVPNSTEALARWIMDPGALAPGTAMPHMGVTAVQAHAMATFLHALR